MRKIMGSLAQISLVALIFAAGAALVSTGVRAQDVFDDEFPAFMADDVYEIEQDDSRVDALETADNDLQQACQIGCYRKRNLPPLPGDVDFCRIWDRNVGRCLEVPDCEFTCR